VEVVTDWDDPAFAGRPVPAPSGVAAEYFAAVETGELRYQDCPSCEHRQFYPRRLCAGCGGEPVWAVSSGRGRVHTFTVVRQNLSPPFASLVPYVLAVVELEEGPRLMGNVTDCQVEDVKIGMAVEAYAVRVREGLGVPFWRPQVGSA
jgi:uncharacterized OB-fold protein